MSTALLTAGLFACAFLCHLAWWRIALPKRHTFALLALFFGALAAWLTLSITLPGRWFVATDPWQALHVAIAHTALTLAYVVTYSALEHRSPSMTMLVAVADSSDEGRTAAELRGLLVGASPVEVRLSAMEREGMVSRERDDYRLAPKGRTWAAVLSNWRRLLGMPQGG